MKDLLKALLLLAVLGLTFVGSFSVLNYVASESRKIPTNVKLQDVPFSVVVVSPDDAAVQSDEPGQLGDYLGKHPAYSYFIPKDQLERVRRQITARYEQENTETRPTLFVESLGQGRQLVHLVEFGEMRSREYWYEARENDKDYLPRAYRFDAALLDFWILPVAASIAGGVALFIFFFGRSAIKFISKKRRPA